MEKVLRVFKLFLIRGKEIITKWKIISKSDRGKPSSFHIGFKTIIIIVKWNKNRNYTQKKKHSTEACIFELFLWVMNPNPEIDIVH